VRRIRFKPIHGISETFVPDVEMIFRDGEVKEISDEDASTLLTNANFVDDDTGWNPTFRCFACGATSLSDAFPSPNNALIPYRDEHGNRLCIEDFLATHVSG